VCEGIVTSVHDGWASMSKLHTSVFDVEFCLHSTYIMAGMASWLRRSLVLHVITASTSNGETTLE